MTKILIRPDRPLIQQTPIKPGDLDDVAKELQSSLEEDIDEAIRKVDRASREDFIKNSREAQEALASARFFATEARDRISRSRLLDVASSSPSIAESEMLRQRVNRIIGLADDISRAATGNLTYEQFEKLRRDQSHWYDEFRDVIRAFISRERVPTGAPVSDFVLGTALNRERRELRRLAEEFQAGRISRSQYEFLSSGITGRQEELGRTVRTTSERGIRRIERGAERGVAEGLAGRNRGQGYRLARDSLRIAKAGATGGYDDLEDVAFRQLRKELGVYDRRVANRIEKYTDWARVGSILLQPQRIHGQPISQPALLREFLEDMTADEQRDVVEKVLFNSANRAIEQGFGDIEKAFERRFTTIPASALNTALNKVNPSLDGYNRFLGRALTGVMRRGYQQGFTRYLDTLDGPRRAIRPNIFIEGIGDSIGEEIADAVRLYLKRTINRRSRSLAKTILARAFNVGSIEAYKKEGIGHVAVIDGTVFDAECRAANGEIWTLEKAEDNPLQHPNCVRRFIPVEEQRDAFTEETRGGLFNTLVRKKVVV